MQAKDIIEDIRAAFISNIGNEEWMDDETQKAATKKVRTCPNMLVKGSVSVLCFVNHELKIGGLMLAIHFYSPIL